ncbi:hypothetical protein CANCADRAFT_101103 [Tortispora caseinolytica NRRL Y-17796]|uniref:Phenylalanine--tRNA ligase, mitochondrial n=1 Tax=Tortispora caseinolytica NRRL Y-17796 TaxID=767744 RepID=A0A1E4TEH6_9ASCO|nr:hypothetical protein CANCADRAFT_101103 [Tortispora caseinolytica NRRL Y-17796]
MLRRIRPFQKCLPLRRLFSDVPRDSTANVTEAVLSHVNRRLHLNDSHPIGILRSIVETRFRSLPGNYSFHNDLDPVVSVKQNFDSLGFPEDHVGRSRNDTYYFNKDTVLRTHTSAHQVDLIAEGAKLGKSQDAFLVSADVYRRDSIDRTHYLAFHQTEGVRYWDRNAFDSEASLIATIREELENMPMPQIKIVEPLCPPFDSETNPVQSTHSPELATAIGDHLRRTLELVIEDIFMKAAESNGTLNSNTEIPVHWLEDKFPFTSPSFQTEVLYNDSWLELLGCGVIQQGVFDKANFPSAVGWAFGIGLDRLAMVLFSIPDIRLFWSDDSRFLDQFNAGKVTKFAPYSKYPSTYRDIAFWLPVSADSEFHENDLTEIVHKHSSGIVQSVSLTDEFTHPKTSRKSLCYRIVYQSMDRTLTNEEVNATQQKISDELVDTFKVEVR